MTLAISISNQKGGVGKTTTAVNLSSYFAEQGFRTLIIDLDPQGNATSGLGVDVHEEGQDVYDMFFGKVSLREILTKTVVPNLDIAPSSRDLIGLEIEIGKTPGRELILSTQINLLRSRYDIIVIDCPPSSGLLSLNALGAANGVLVPLQAEYYALEGLSALMGTIKFVQGTFNPELSIIGVFVTMYDGRTNLSKDVLAEAKTHLGDLTFETTVPRSIRLSESPSHRLPINLYDRTCAGALAYEELSREIVERCGLDPSAMPVEAVGVETCAAQTSTVQAVQVEGSKAPLGSIDSRGISKAVNS